MLLEIGLGIWVGDFAATYDENRGGAEHTEKESPAFAELSAVVVVTGNLPRVV